MPLPKIKYPLQSIRLPTFPDDEVIIRPYTTKEEVVLLLGGQNDDSRNKMLAIEQVINNCIVKAPKYINTDTLSIPDIEFIFMKLRMISYSNLLSLSYSPESEECLGKRAKENDEFGPCEGTVPFLIDLNDVDFSSPIDPTIHRGVVNVKLSDEMSVDISYPKLKDKDNFDACMEAKNPDPVAANNLLSSVITTVYDGEQIFKAEEDFTPQEMSEFCESLTLQMKKDIFSVIINVPKMVVRTDIVCKRCKMSVPYKIEGIESFFV